MAQHEILTLKNKQAKLLADLEKLNSEIELETNKLIKVADKKGFVDLGNGKIFKKTATPKTSTKIDYDQFRTSLFNVFGTADHSRLEEAIKEVTTIRESISGVKLVKVVLEEFKNHVDNKTIIRAQLQQATTDTTTEIVSYDIVDLKV